MKKATMLFLLAGMLLIICGPMLAHHGFGVAFEMARPITQTGTVTEVMWSNPHVQLFYDVKTDKGTVNWAAELTNPRALVRMGFTKDILKPGDTITITLNPAKSGAPRGLIVRCLLGNKLVYDDKKPVEDLYK